MKALSFFLAAMAAVSLSAQIEVISGGNVGIGTSSPAQRLEVYEGDIQVTKASADARLRLVSGSQDYRISTQANGNFAFYDATDATYRFLIDTNGNVGIGTTSPAGQLHLLSSGHTSLILDTTGQNSPYLSFRQANVEKGYIQYLDNGAGTDALTYSAPAHSFLGGNVGIGAASPSYKLQVSGSVRANSFISDTTTYADFVFDPDYKLPALSEVEVHIREKRHLPGIPSEAEARERGIDLAAMQVRLLQKVEELTLHAIAQEKEIAGLKRQLAALAR